MFAGFGNGLEDSAWNAWIGPMEHSNEVGALNVLAPTSADFPLRYLAFCMVSTGLVLCLHHWLQRA